MKINNFCIVSKHIIKYTSKKTEIFLLFHKYFNYNNITYLDIYIIINTLQLLKNYRIIIMIRSCKL